MANQEPIAVIGMSYRAPGIGRKGLWDYLAQARSAWTRVPADRFQESAYYRRGGDRTGVMSTQGAHFIDDPYGFDAAFFNMRADEAKHADPQHRLMLEVALEAAEDAGLGLADIAGQKIGVFVGSGQHEYAQRLGDDEHVVQTFSGTGNAVCMAANRVSYFFDIDGPSVVSDAACASSVYAAHVAVNALRNGECTAAFVGTASLNLSPAGWLVLEKTGALSEHGRSYSYDAKASGFGRGEGAACLFIKRMEDAVRDGDPIHAVIRGTACNHSGRSDGITMPNGLAQQKLLWAVHNAAGLDPSDTPVIEGHGTGTGVGDPIESGAFTAVLGRNRTSANPLHLGSIKSNFGHLEGASGVLAMVKAIMQVKNGIVLPTAGFESINPKIQDSEKVRIAEMPLPWPENEPRRCLVTNFGFGGSNSAIIIEKAPVDTAKPNGATNGHSNGVNGHDGIATTGTNGHSNGTNGHSNGAEVQTRRLFAFSAKTQKSLTSYLASWDDYLDEAPEAGDFFRDLSYTLGQRRTHFPYRAAAQADSVEGLQEALSALKPVRTKDRILNFAFTGQGAQYAQMALALKSFKVFAQALEEAESHLQKLGSPWSLVAELSKPAAESRVGEAEISQPACTAVQLALVALLTSWGIVPTAVAGHSSGEIAAAFAAGLVSFPEAVAVAYFRGQAAARLASQQGPDQRGAMLALGVGAEEATELIEEHGGGYATVAAVNSFNSVTISGDAPVIDRVFKAAEAKGVFARKLNVGMAYHSRHMEQVAGWYLDAITPYCGQVSLGKTGAQQRPVFVSSVTGQVEDSVGASYWIKNLVRPVLFADAVQGVLTLFEGSDNVLLKAMPKVIIEVGPHAALKNPIKQTVEAIQAAKNWGPASFTYVPTLVRGTDAEEAALDLASTLYTLGAPVQLGAVNQTDQKNSHVLTGLPSYAWDKTRYELRPRATHEKFCPGEDYHPLIGRKMPTTGGQERAYRQVFTLDEMPWIRDHVVGGSTIFPMTGYMCCALEAARRTLPGPAQAEAFLVTDFHIARSLEVLEEQTVDLVTKLWPAAIGEGAFSAKAWSFEINTWAEEDGWTTHCWGQIEPEMTPMTLDTPTLQTCLPLAQDVSGLYEHDIEKEYAAAAQRATQYGPSFKNNVRFFEGDGYTVMEHRLRDLGEEARNDPFARGSPATVDPPTIDGFLQGGGPLQYDEQGRKPAQMPNYISRFRVSNQMPSAPQTRFDVVMRKLKYDSKGGRLYVCVAVYARDPGSGALTPVCEFESSRFRNIGSADAIIDPAANVPDNWAWTVLPKFDCLPPDALRKTVGQSVPELGPEEDERLEKLGRAGLYYISAALQQTAGEDFSEMPDHLRRFHRWAAKALAESGLEFPEEPTQLLNEVRAADAQGVLLCAIGDNLVDILRGEVEPLEIMLTDNRLTKNYENGTNEYLSQVLGHYAEMLADLEPNQRILEIGAGTAGTTLPILEGLSKDRDEPGFMSYTFTDVSSGFFEGARRKLDRWGPRITYKKLDITQDPAAQGFAPEEFDVVVAANVLHATPDMVRTIRTVRGLLKPGGKLLLLEGNQHTATLLPFTLTPGWWLSEDRYRAHGDGPMMPVAVWDELLRECGFAGVETTVPSSWNAATPLMSVMSSTRIGPQDESRALVVSGPFVDDAEVAFAQGVADLVARQLGCAVDVRPLAELDADEEPYCIFIDSVRESVMQNMTRDKFRRLQDLILHNAGLLWITPEGAAPDANMILGMLRTVRLESDPKTLTLFQEVPSTPAGARGILQVARRLRDPEVTRHQDQDLVWKDGSVHFPRMRQLRDVKEQFAVEQDIAFLKVQNLWGDQKPGQRQSERALEMTIDAAGSPDTLYFRRTDAGGDQALGDDEVLVRVEAAGLSHRDLEVVLGAVPWAPPGYDGCGKVVRAGARVAHVREGDDVFFLSPASSALATYKQLPSWQVARVPAAMGVADAATLPLAYSLAVLALVHTARARQGDTVLVHAAAGAVGQACVRLAQHLGATVYATAGTDAKRAFLRDSYGLPPGRVFSSRTPAFRDSILAATGGRGVDVIVNMLSGELLTETWQLAAPYARFVEVGGRDPFLNNSLPMGPFHRGVSFAAVDLRDLYRHRPDDVRDVFAEVVRLVRQGVARPLGPVAAVPVSQIAAALRRLKSSDHSGKVVATFGPDERFMAETPLRPSAVAMNGHATYVVTGGTRGIGLELAYWLIEHGARSLVLLGRSGAKGEDVQKLLAKYQDTDVTIRALACNVGRREELAAVMESIQDMPPVKGVVHSALLLSDKLFVNATYEDWEINTTPRLHGAWNLHELMPPDLDFFVALSSFSGDTGNIGQAIYAGTAGFYDAFAKYRNQQGRYTVSIALPVVLDVGYVVEHNITELLKMALGASLTMADIRALFKSAVGGSLGRPSPFVQASGRATAFKVYVDGQAVSHGAWKYFHPVHTKERLAEAAALQSRAAAAHGGAAGGGVDYAALASWTAAEDPQLGLTEALITKVAAMTMMERDEVLADAPLGSYNLDSLVSVELRNWIRRETTVELTLSAIMHADSLRALASEILAQRKTD